MGTLYTCLNIHIREKCIIIARTNFGQPTHRPTDRHGQLNVSNRMKGLLMTTLLAIVLETVILSCVYLYHSLVRLFQTTRYTYLMTEIPPPR